MAFPENIVTFEDVISYNPSGINIISIYPSGELKSLVAKTGNLKLVPEMDSPVPRVYNNANQIESGRFIVTDSLTPNTGEVYINPSTGAYKFNAAETASNAWFYYTGYGSLVTASGYYNSVADTVENIQSHLLSSGVPRLDLVEVYASGIADDLANNYFTAEYVSSGLSYLEVEISNTNIRLSTTSGDLASHLADLDNPHQTTYAQIGASPSGHSHNDLYYTEQEVDALISGIETSGGTPSGIVEHLTDYVNPHQVTYVQVGASPSGHNHDLEYAIISHNHSGIYEPANVNIQAHIQDTENPHSVTYIQVGASPSGHTHDDRYYTESELDVITSGINQDILSVSGDISLHVLDLDNPHQTNYVQVGASPSGHNHDLEYYTQSQVDVISSGLNEDIISVSGDLNLHLLDLNNPHQVTYVQVGASPSGHAHNDLYYTETEIDATVSGLNENIVGISGDLNNHILDLENPHQTTYLHVGASPSGHLHDDRYFTETEVTILVEDIAAEISGTNNNILAVSGDLAAHLADYNNPHLVSYDQVGASPSGHTHDDRYYTESEIDVISSGLNADMLSVSGELNSHESNTDNPHSVTYAQVGAAQDIHTHDASGIVSGTLADARLSSNVPLKDAANIFSANQYAPIFSGGYILSVSGFQSTGVGPTYIWEDPDEGNIEYPCVSGNPRGLWATDLQVYRNSADQVASASGSTIGGGLRNQSSGPWSVIGGGTDNLASVDYASIAGGKLNVIYGSYGVITGGVRNTCSGGYGFIGGGDSNIVHDDNCAIGGGQGNGVSGSHSYIGGGISNIVTNNYSTIGGGYLNETAGSNSTIGGGDRNVISASGDDGSILGGDQNKVEANGASVGGGRANYATGRLSAIPGGAYLRTTCHSQAAVGQFNKISVPTIDNDTYSPNDILFMVGNGTADATESRSNALEVYGNGNVGISGVLTVASGIIGTGAAITALSATNISTGTLADARLSTNVPLLNAANIFTNTQTINAAVIINDTGADVDTRIEGDTDTNLFFVDASADRVGIGTNAPTYKLDVLIADDTSTAGIKIRNSDGSFLISNGTSAANSFYPFFKTIAAGDNTGAIFISEIPATEDDVGKTVPVFAFQSQLSTPAAVANRDLLKIKNYTTEVLTISASGNLTNTGIVRSNAGFNVNGSVGYTGSIDTGAQILNFVGGILTSVT